MIYERHYRESLTQTWPRMLYCLSGTGWVCLPLRQPVFAVDRCRVNPDRRLYSILRSSRVFPCPKQQLMCNLVVLFEKVNRYIRLKIKNVGYKK